MAFADDLICFVQNKQSYNALTRLLDDFGIFSGLKKNRDKTEVFRLGQNANEGLAEKLEIQEIKATVKILGIHFTYNEDMFRKLNFESMIKSIKLCLNSWNWRELTLIGKVQVIKAFAVPKVLYRTAVLPREGEFMKEINNLMFGFRWVNDGNDLGCKI